ncbi:MAG TPA: hypothetical protein VFJ58_19100 [Armatimonadota bacterium]|nr:hypothetical protein [Armatimonadota bacterium]
MFAGAPLAHLSRSTFRVRAAAALVILIVCGFTLSLGGCGLSGGGIPPGGVVSPPALSFTATGRVRSALPPYDTLTQAAVSVRTQAGATIAGPVPVAGDGSFVLANVPLGAVTLQVTTPDTTLRPVAIAFQIQQPGSVRFIIAVPPIYSTPATAVTLAPASNSPLLLQTDNIHATLVGASPAGLAPSWIAFGNAGNLSAVGPSAVFSAEGPGSETIIALSDGALAEVTLNVPTTPPGSGGNTSGGGATTSGTGSTTSGSGSTTSGSGGTGSSTTIYSGP